MSRAPLALLLVAALALGAGCGSSSGGDDDGGRTVSGDPTTTVETSATTGQPGEPGPEIVTTTTPVTTPEPDAGDEEGIRVPADFTLEGGALTPARITVPPQLPIAVTVKAADGQAHELLFSTVPPVTVEVPAGAPGTALIPGQRQGTYAVNVDGGPARPALVAVDDAGP